MNNTDLRYDWSEYLSLGFSKDFIAQQESMWADGILEIVTNEDLADNCCSNLKLLLDTYSYETSFLFLIYYSSSFIRDPDVFLDRFTSIKQKLGPSWAQILLDKLYAEEFSPFEAIGYLADKDWLEALDSI